MYTPGNSNSTRCLSRQFLTISLLFVLARHRFSVINGGMRDWLGLNVVILLVNLGRLIFGDNLVVWKNDVEEHGDDTSRKD